MKLSETAKEVIDLAESARNYWAAELPKRHPHYPVITRSEDSGPPPPEEEKLRHLLSRLPDEVVYKLTLIMYLGRGDIDADDLAEEYKLVQEKFGKSELAAQMMEKAPLADYLADGLEELKRRHVEVDDLPVEPANSRG